MKCLIKIYNDNFMDISNITEYEIIQGYIKRIDNGYFKIYYSPIHSIKINRYIKLGYHEM